MTLKVLHGHQTCSNHHLSSFLYPQVLYSSCFLQNFGTAKMLQQLKNVPAIGIKYNRGKMGHNSLPRRSILASFHQLDLTEDNVKQVLVDARVEFGQIFDQSVGITGQAELAELDGPFVKISLRGKFWHKRSTVLARLGTYLKQRIPEILEVDIEDEKQLDDSPENF